MTPRKAAKSSASDQSAQRRSGRHPNAHHTELRFTNAAVDDLLALQKKNRSALGWAMKKFILIERNPEAGAPLGGGLHGYRKLTVSDRDWRIVWRVTFDELEIRLSTSVRSGLWGPERTARSTRRCTAA